MPLDDVDPKGADTDLRNMGQMDEDLDELQWITHLEDVQILGFSSPLFEKPLLMILTHSYLQMHQIDFKTPHKIPDTSDPNLILPSKHYFANTTVHAYNCIHKATIKRHPEETYTVIHIQLLPLEASHLQTQWCCPDR